MFFDRLDADRDALQLISRPTLEKTFCATQELTMTVFLFRAALAAAAVVVVVDWLLPV